MYTYRFLRHEVRRCGRAVDESYQQVVAEQARAGWRLVQVLVEEPAAMVTSYVLVLERPAAAEEGSWQAPTS